MERAIQEKSFHFAVRITKLCRHLRCEKREFTLTQQLLRSGTSIGANVVEAEQAESRADFTHKMSIALKEAKETNYWLRLMYETEYLSDKEFNSIMRDCLEVEMLLVSIVKTTKK